MNSKMPSEDERDEITSLVAKSAHELSTRASLATRGLRDITDHIRADAVRSAQDQGWELHKQGRFAEAVTVCSAALEADPTDEGLWLIKGVCLAEQGRVDEGLDCLNRALESDAEDHHCWVLRAILLHRLNRTEEQLECWRRVIGIVPDFQGAWKHVGRCLLDLGRYDEAVQAFDSEMRLNPLDEDCRSRRNVALTELAHSRQDLSNSDRTRPTIVLTIRHWWTEPYYKAPPFADTKCFSFVCHVQNVSDQPQRLGKEVTVHHRSKATGEVFKVADAMFVESPPPLRLAPKAESDPVILELLWPFPAEQPEEDCVREILDDTYETLAYDDEFETVIMIARE